ncbi:MAG: hypothetical protein EXR98_03050 [Gemmataceae bacterium]|nr:hypothetical protein [Gemmataceae bacterium]
MSDNLAGFLSRIGRGVLGCLPGAFFGLLVQAFCGWNIDPEAAGGRYFPWQGGAIGAVVGFLFAFAFGHLEIRGRTRLVIIGMLSGLAIGFAASYIIGLCWPPFDGKEQTIHILVAITFGTPLGTLIGGVVGFLKKDTDSPASK